MTQGLLCFILNFSFSIYLFLDWLYIKHSTFQYVHVNEYINKYRLGQKTPVGVNLSYSK